MHVPADLRAHFIGTVAQMVADDIAAQGLPSATADRLRGMLAGITEAAEELREQLSPGAHPAKDVPVVDGTLPRNVLDLRSWKRR